MTDLSNTVTLTPTQMAEVGPIYHCLSCTEGQGYQFVFDRRKAADAAIALARFSPYKGTVLASAGEAGTYSAMFMSLAYYAGGIPMVATGRGTQSPPSGNGWHATYGGNGIYGNPVWYNHSDAATDPYAVPVVDPTFDSVPRSAIGGNGLLQLIAGNSAVASKEGSLPGAPTEAQWIATSSREALVVPRAKFFKDLEDGRNVLSSGQFKDAQNPNMPGPDSGWLDTLNKFKCGDYVFYRTAAEKKAHGLMVVGYGPTINWAEFVDAPNARMDKSWRTDLDGYFFSPSPTTGFATYASFLDGKGQTTHVPYVADWWRHDEKVLLQGPRPFYATYFTGDGAHPLDRQADQTYWLFVPAPNQGSVLCEYAYAQNCSSAPLFVDGSNPEPARLEDVLLRLASSVG